MQLFPALPEVVQGTFRPAPFGRLERRAEAPAKGGFILNQTTNYQLSQWETTDRILMSDFNDDNAKIDAALKANADAISSETSDRKTAVMVETSARQAADTSLKNSLDTLEEKTLPQKLKSVTVSSATDQLQVSLSAIDWGQWAQIHFLVTAKVDNVTPIIYYLGGYQIGSSSTDVHLVFYPVYTDTTEAAGLFLSTQGSSVVCSSLTYSELSVLNLKSFDAPDKCILPGTKVEIWGLK